MQNLIKFITFSFTIALCAGCGTSIKTTGPSIENGTVQSGKPFSNVPDRRDITLYQVNMRAFSEEGNFQGVIKRLDSIKALGANVLYLMPHYPVGKVKAVNSPYCIQDYKAVNPEFGTLADLRAVVDGAHQRNLAVLIDWVANHTSYDHVWINNKTWYQQDSTGNIISPPGTGWNDVAQLDFKNAEMRLAMIDAMKYWIYAANIDGFRCDYSDGPPVDFWKQAIDTLKNTFRHKFLMLSEGRRMEHYQIGFDYNFGFGFFENMKRIYEHNKSVLTIDTLNNTDYAGTSEGQQIIRYTSNHDVNGSDGTPIELFGGEKGSMAAFVVVAYMKSVPMIYNGQEVGTPYRLVFPFTSKKIDWTINPAITAEYKKIIHFRNSSNVIRRGDLISYSTDDVCAFTKKLGKEEVLVISNLRNSVINFTVPSILANTIWQNAIGGNRFTLKTSISLQPFTYLILKK